MNDPKELLKESAANLDASYDWAEDNVGIPTVRALQSIAGALQAIALILLTTAKRKPSER